jgi:hypothetical protein
MPDDSRAPNITPPPVFGGADYDAIFAALAASERGRWFLDECGRRRRGADTDLVLAAIGRIEAAMQAGKTPILHGSVPGTVRRDLAGAADAISRARHGIGYGGTGTTEEAEAGDAADILRTLIDEIDWRLHSLTEALLPSEDPAHETRDLAAPPPANPPADFEEFTVAESEQPSPAQEATDPLADLTTGGFSEPAPAVAEDSATEATVTDWAFAEEQAQPPAVDPEQPVAASDEVAASLVLQEPTPEPLQIDDVVGRPERLDASPIRAAIEALIAAEPPPAGARVASSPWMVPAPASEPPSDLLVTEAPSPQGGKTNGAMFDSGLFDAETPASNDRKASGEVPPGLIEPAEHGDDALGSPDFWRDLTNGNSESLARADEPEPPPAMPPPAPPASATAEPAKEKADVLQRLEHMRKSIASLMDEIAVKTGRPIERPQR